MKIQPSASSERRTFVRWVSGAALSLACAAGITLLSRTPALAEPAAPAAPATQPTTGDMKAFTDTISGTALKLDMVPIPGGTLKWGSPDSEKKHKDDEGPIVDVSIDPFYMGKFEITWELYNEFLGQYSKLGEVADLKRVPFEDLADAVSYPTPIYDVEAAPALQRMGGRQGRLPAVIMSQFAAKQFTKWLSAKTGRFYRLPTEAEWEYAARGGTNTAYFFGDDAKKLGDYAWFYDNSELPDQEPGYREVGQKKPNPYGLYDIYGNVGEIVIDQYQEDWYKTLASKKGPIPEFDAVRWPEKQYPRIVRGGGYESDAEDCRSAARRRISVAQNSRDPQSPKSPYWWTEGFGIGFRVVSPVKEATAAEKAKYWDADSEAILDVLKRDREIRQRMDELGPKK